MVSTVEQMNLVDGTQHDPPLSTSSPAHSPHSLQSPHSPSPRSPHTSQPDAFSDGEEEDEYHMSLEEDLSPTPVPFKYYTSNETIEGRMMAEVKWLKQEVEAPLARSLDDVVLFSLLSANDVEWNPNRLLLKLTTEEGMTQISEMAPLVDPTSLTPWTKEWGDPITLTSVDKESETTVLPCGHRFANDTLVNWLNTRLTDQTAKEAMCSKCPSCPCVIPSSVWRLDDHLAEALIKHLRHLFVDKHPRFRWCGVPRCDVMVELSDSQPDLPFICPCQQSNLNHQLKQCFECGNEWHNPVPCEVLKEWESRKKTDGRNAFWMFINSKPCPNKTCQAPIQKDSGCLHMTCTRCSHQFCWLCMSDWQNHKYPCNTAKAPLTVERDMRAESPQMTVYNHYFNRFNAHHEGQMYAGAVLKQEVTSLVSHLDSDVAQVYMQAVDTIVECRRMLKFSYAFGFYIHGLHNTKEEDEVEVAMIRNKAKLFDTQQGMLESVVDVLDGSLSLVNVSGKDLRFDSPLYTSVKHITHSVRTAFNNISHFMSTETEVRRSATNIARALVEEKRNELLSFKLSEVTQ
eukprot:GHVN01028145.1.p1 GENE.GHVN01028145.1~~GHVN01028145.1.p1  ORF type:complete len:571 (+),score=103.68 GHVN01028145.1:675-2387(+)